MKGQWATVFGFAALMDVVGIVVFWAWGQATPQPALDPRQQS
jgi:hypothetical protein